MYYKQKVKKQKSHFFLGSLIGSILILGIITGLLFIPIIQGKVADVMVEKSSIYQDTVEQVDTLLQEKQENENQISLLEETITLKTNQITTLNTNITTLTTQKNALETQLQNEQNIKQTLLSNISILNTRITQLETTKEQLEIDLENEINDKETIQTMLDNVIIELNSTQSLLDDAENDLLIANDNIENLNLVIEDNESIISDLLNQISELEEEIELLQSQLGTTQTDSNFVETYKYTKYSYTPDGIGYNWMIASFADDMDFNYDIYTCSEGTHAYDLLLSRLNSNWFYGFNVLDYYDLYVKDARKTVTYYKESRLYVDDNTDLTFKIVDGSENVITDFENYISSNCYQLIINELEYENDIITKVDCKLIITKNHLLRERYICNDGILTFNKNNRTFTFNDVEGYYDVDNGLINFYTLDSYTMFNQGYLISDNEMVIDGVLFEYMCTGTIKANIKCDFEEDYSFILVIDGDTSNGKIMYRDEVLMELTFEVTENDDGSIYLYDSQYKASMTLTNIEYYIHDDVREIMVAHVDNNILTNID